MQFNELKEHVRAIIIDLLDNRYVTHFISGMALGFDMLAAQIIVELKELYPHITLECIIPYESQASKWPESERDTYLLRLTHPLSII